MPIASAIDAESSQAIYIARSERPCPKTMPWRHHWRDGNEVVLSLAQEGDHYWLRFPQLAEFWLQADAGQILLAPDASADANTLEHLLVDQILPRCLAHRQQLVVHACAVTIGERHALFLGPSGWGKSTLAGLLHLRGHTVHSDDCVQLRSTLGRFEALPTYPSLRLYPDSLGTLFADAPITARMASYSEKLRVPLSLPAGGHEATAVDALYVLGDPSNAGKTAQISPLPPSQTCQALIRHSFRLDLGDRAGNAAHFARCADVVNGVPAFQLDYPRDYAQSEALVNSITQHLSNRLSPF